MADTLKKQYGKLYIVATPIGNLGDITHRAIETFSRVDLVVVEDTRVTGKLLNHLGIKKPMLSLHAHNESRATKGLIQRLFQGESIALVSDAGTPLISDPGFPLVREARVNGVEVLAIPGPCAVVAALSIAGIPCDRFVFEGFLPAKEGARKKLLEQLLDEPRTMVYYESPHRIIQTLGNIREVFGGNRKAAVARELTKQFEQTESGSLEELCEWVNLSRDHSRGEFVIIVSGNNTDTKRNEVNADQLLSVLLEEVAVKKAAAMASRLTNISKNELYSRALELKNSNKS